MSQNQKRKRPNCPSKVNSKLWRPIQTPCDLDQTENRKKIRKMGKNKWDHVGVGPPCFEPENLKAGFVLFYFIFGISKCVPAAGSGLQIKFQLYSIFPFSFSVFQFFFLKKKKINCGFLGWRLLGRWYSTILTCLDKIRQLVLWHVYVIRFPLFSKLPVIPRSSLLFYRLRLAPFLSDLHTFLMTQMPTLASPSLPSNLVK